MTIPGTSPAGDGGVHGNTFNGPTAIQADDRGTQNIQFVYQWKPAYRIEDFPAAPRPVSARVLAEQPSRLLRAAHQVVPFTGRRHDLDKLSRWRDDPAPRWPSGWCMAPAGRARPAWSPGSPT